MKNCLEKSGVKTIFSSEVIGFEKKGLPAQAGKKVTALNLQSGKITAKKYILCTGGRSYSATGSDGSGYKLAEKLGHTVEKPKPALCPVNVVEKWVEGLQGISLEDVKVSVLQNNKKMAVEEGGIIFTRSGLSGPAILNISGKVVSLLEKDLAAQAGEVKICIDIFPLLNYEELLKGIEDILKKHAGRTIKNILSIFVPERLAEILAEVAGIDKNKVANSMSKLEKNKVIKVLKNIELTANDVLGFDAAMVTRGGVSLKEIDHKTMKSKIIDNLYFAGEIIDVDGKTGGFNLQACWSTGFLAGN